jgi:hypothetical protein
VKDERGQVVARLTHDWSIEGSLGAKEAARAQTALFRKALPLAPGQYVLELAAQDRRTGATSVSRKDFGVPEAAPDLALGSVTVVRRASSAAVDDPPGDPLRVGDISLVPGLGEAFDPGVSPEVPVFVAVYPGHRDEPVELTVALLRDGREVVRTTPELGAVDSEGRIAWIGSLPAARLVAGAYEIVVTARQGEAAAEERAQFDIAPTSANDTTAAPDR